MIRFIPVLYRTEDDSAPNDYRIVGSVAEGQRLRQAQPMHKPTPADATVRHRAEPDDPATLGNGRMRAPRGQPEGDVEGAIAPASRIAYPRSRNNAFADAPAYDVPAPQTFAPTQARPAPQAPAAPVESLDGAFGAPSAPEVPDWLRMAQQNNAPYFDEEHRRRTPRVQSAPRQPEPQYDALGRPMRAPRPAPAPAAPQGGLPRTSEDYARAGYPPELILEQQAQDARQLTMGGAPSRHGAQYATGASTRTVRPGGDRRMPPSVAGQPSPPPREPDQRRAPSTFAPPVSGEYAPPARMPLSRYGNGEPQPIAEPWNDPQPPEDSTAYTENPYVVRTEPRARRHRRAEEDEEAEPTRPPKPWLGIAVIAAAVVAIACWLMQMGFTKATDAVKSARESAQVALLDAHPLYYADLIRQEAERNNLHPAFVAAIMLNESSFRPSAESSIGARGLMQLREDTASWIATKLGDDGYTFDGMYDADTNVRYGCWYLSFLSDRFRGDPILVAAAFHAGQNTVQNWLNDSHYSADGKSITLDNMMDGPTKTYATRVLNAYAVYKRLYYENAV